MSVIENSNLRVDQSTTREVIRTNSIQIDPMVPRSPKQYVYELLLAIYQIEHSLGELALEHEINMFEPGGISGQAQFMNLTSQVKQHKELIWKRIY